MFVCYPDSLFHSIFLSFPAPCPPENVRYIGSTQSAVLSWNASVFATSYTVYDVSGTGRTILCNTTSLSCQLTNFNVSATEITASNAIGESNANRNITGEALSTLSGFYFTFKVTVKFN